MNCESSVGPVRRELHVLYVPLTPMVTTRVIEALTRPPVVEEAWTAPVQSGVPAGRRTRVSPGDAKVPRTLRVICVFGAMVEGLNPTSGGEGGGGEGGGGEGGGGEGGGDGGGGEGGGGDGGGDGGGSDGGGGEGEGGGGGGSGGDAGGRGCRGWRGPQSKQSVPYWQSGYSAPGPPSSHQPSEA